MGKGFTPTDKRPRNTIRRYSNSARNLRNPVPRISEVHTTTFRNQGTAEFLARLSEERQRDLSPCLPEYEGTIYWLRNRTGWLPRAMDGLRRKWARGGNVKLNSCNLSDYQVSILEVAGSAHNDDDIRAMEALWKDKHLSCKMGLNAN
jgi:hypothetical protein